MNYYFCLQIVKINNWLQIKDELEIKKLCEKILQENPKLVQQYVKGKTKVFNAILGKIATSSKNRANMEDVTNVLKQMLKEISNNK